MIPLVQEIKHLVEIILIIVYLGCATMIFGVMRYYFGNDIKKNNVKLISIQLASSLFIVLFFAKAIQKIFF